MKVIFSPALYCRSNELFDLYLLNDTLDFIVKYLDGSLDDYEDAFYNNNRLFLPPVMNNVTEMMQYTAIITNLYKLKQNGKNINIVRHDNSYKIYDSDFQVVNDTEFQKIIDYLQYLFSNNQSNDILMFTDKVNDSYHNKSLKIEINNIPYNIPIVGDPMLDESGNFNSYINLKTSDEYKIFKCRGMCTKLVEKMEKNHSSGGNSSLFKRYGKIIALRNLFDFYSPNNPFEKNTHYFISHDKQYIISIDLKHGHFEIFDNTNGKQWIAKYKFSGEVISEPTDYKKLKAQRTNHKVEK